MGGCRRGYGNGFLKLSVVKKVGCGSNSPPTPGRPTPTQPLRMWRHLTSRDAQTGRCATSNALRHLGVIASRHGRRLRDWHLGTHRLHLPGPGVAAVEWRGTTIGTIGRRGAVWRRSGAARQCGGVAAWRRRAAAWRRGAAPGGAAVAHRVFVAAGALHPGRFRLLSVDLAERRLAVRDRHLDC